MSLQLQNENLETSIYQNQAKNNIRRTLLDDKTNAMEKKFRNLFKINKKIEEKSNQVLLNKRQSTIFINSYLIKDNAIIEYEA